MFSRVTLALGFVALFACGSERPEPTNSSNGGGSNAWYEQQWDYASTAAMKAAAYFTVEAQGGTIALQTSGVEGGQSSVNKALRATYSTTQQSTAELSLLPPNFDVTKPREVWVEVYLRFNASWNAQSDDKTFFYLEDQSAAGGPGETARWETHIVTPTYWYGGPSGAVGVQLPDFFKYQGASLNPWDGNWHRFRHHFRMSSSPNATDGAYRVWWDNQLVINQTGIATNSPAQAFFRNVSLGANADPAGSGIRDWGRLRIFTSNPGW